MKSDRTDLEKAGPTDAGAVLPNPPNVELIMDRAFGSTHLGLRQLAQDLGLSLSDLGCTALGLLLNTETGRGAVGQIGDGALLGLRKHGTVEELVTAPDTGDPQATYTLTRTDFTNYLKVQLIRSVADDPYVAFYVMTDGLSGDLLYSPRAEAVRAWAQKVDWNLRVSSSPAQAAGGLINWLATYQVTGSWDDRTLVAITQVERENGDSERATEQPQPAELHHDQ
ncbi:MAG: protein phosphatase 2C domain-containing protein [Chloroflexi bacterium]|nr:protein phosphatase 2C domain-containing protein [Chloroflexota bacterium]